MTKSKKLILRCLYESLDPLIILTSEISKEECPHSVQIAIISVLKALIELDPEILESELFEPDLEENLNRIFPCNQNFRRDH